MSPLSMPVLAGAAVLSSPALWALTQGTASADVALTRYLVSVGICWVLLALVTALVGPAPARADDAADGPAGAGEAGDFGVTEPVPADHRVAPPAAAMS